MKSDRVLLAEWLGDTTDGYTDIPWPLIHDRAGDEIVRWLNQQDHTLCQMILEKDSEMNAGMHRLYAEFYQPALRTEFALRFAK
jgi:hypothetical protein